MKKLSKEIIKEDLEDKTKRSQLIRCEECPKRCSTHKFVTNKEKAEILADKEKLKEMLNCDPPANPLDYKPPPRYGVYSKI